ncbi:irregular chiasm C-roughest protein-like isoform X2 [Panonychus citri]|uniref:irregular chiasm C-roughest protein-like isoform X2 n=1 Tax=Panonychus citri TaxID=50023 RepID=UPI0023075D4A|nr:irregular chiasm C-roughest protein-like isoform X2 [Panonychus citri]
MIPSCFKLSSSSSFTSNTRILKIMNILSIPCNLLLLILISYPPSTLGFSQYFSETPTHNLTIAEGSSATLPCTVRNLQGACVWNHNTRAVWTNRPSNGDCSYKINKVSLEKHEGLWQCQVTPPYEGVGEGLVSMPITITVLVRPDRPHIERSPKHAQTIPITANSSEVITCNVYNGNPLPKIEWFLNDKNITDQATSRTTVPGTATGKKDTLTMSELKYQFTQEHNNQTLSCQANHQTGSTYDAVTIKVLYIPILSVPKPVYSVKEGSEIRIDCKVDANPPATVFWKDQARGAPVLSENPAVLWFREAKRDMNGAIFECFAQNEKGVARPVPVRIDVLYQPHSVNYSTEQSVQTGKSIKLYCFFDGNPKPEVHWYQIDPRTSQHHRIDMPSDNNQILLIANATYSHEGKYYCQATNIINDVTNVIKSPPMMLDIYGAPAFPHMEPMLVEGPRGQKSHLTLDFCCDPAPNAVHWYYGSTQLDVKAISYPESDNVPANNSLLRHRILPLNNIQSKNSPSEQFKCYEAQLEIRDTDLNDERDYTLVVKNQYGTATRIARLKVVSPLSLGFVIGTVLVVIFATILLSFLLMVLMKCQRKPKDAGDEESGEDSQALSQSINTNNSDPIKTKPPSEKGNPENYEMVYANLEFTNNAENGGGRPIPPTTKPKPVIQSRTSLRGNGTPAGNLAGVMMANQQAVAAMAAHQQQNQHQLPNNQHNNHNNQQHPASLHGTEYAKISFPTKADL